MREDARRTERSTNPALQASDGRADQADEIFQSQEKPVPTQVSRRVNHVIITNDPEPSHPEGGTAPSSDQQAALEESNLGEEQRRWLARVRRCNATRTVGPSYSTRPSSANASIIDHQEAKLMVDGCADTSIAAIGSGFVEVSRSERMVKLVGIANDLIKEDVPIGSAAAAIDLPSGTFIIQLNETPLLQGGSNSLLSTFQAREFGIKVDDVASRHGGSQKILAGGQAIPLQIEQALLYASIREPTKHELVNLPRIMLTGGEVWDPGSFGDTPEVVKDKGGSHFLALSSISSKTGGVSTHQDTPNSPTIIHLRQVSTHDEGGKTTCTSFASNISNFSPPSTKKQGITHDPYLLHDTLKHPVDHLHCEESTGASQGTLMVEGSDQEGGVLGCPVSGSTNNHDLADARRDLTSSNVTKAIPPEDVGRRGQGSEGRKPRVTGSYTLSTLRNGAHKTTKHMHPSHISRYKSLSSSQHDLRWNQIRRVNTGPKRLLQMSRIMDMQSKKQCSRHKHGSRTSSSDLEATTPDLRQEG